MFPVLVLELDLGYDCFVHDLYKLRQHTGFTKFRAKYYVNGTSHSKMLTKGNMYPLLQALQTSSTYCFYKIKPLDQ